MNKKYMSKEGAYTTMTETEIGKMTYNVKAVMRDILIKNLGYENIPRAGITEDQTLDFFIDGEDDKRVSISCKFSKANKDEMTIYFNSDWSTRFYDGDFWFIYFRDGKDNPYIGSCSQEEWLERFPSAKTADEEVELDGEEELQSKNDDSVNCYPMYNINVEKGFYSFFELKRKYDNPNKRIILDAEFQRESVWKPNQKAELIESILMGLPLPIFYFNQDKYGRLIVIDGRQRLTALFEFMSDEWQLRGLKVLKDLNGKKFSALDPIIQSQIEDYQIQAHVIQPPTPDRIKFDIFDRVNRAGTQLNKQEIRNALYQGKSTLLLNIIAADDSFNNATGGAFAKDTRMKGKYIILRFIAFEMLFEEKLHKDGEKYEYRNDMEELLGLTMETINDMTEADINDIKEYTKEALKKTFDVLGEDAFRLTRSDGSRSPINMNVFETVMHVMRGAYNKNISEDYLKVSIDNLKANEKFLDAIGNHRDNINKVLKRYNMANKILKNEILK